MNFDSVVEFLKENKSEVYSKLGVVEETSLNSLKAEIESLKSEKEKLADKLNSSSNDSVKLSVLRDELKSMGQEVMVSQSSFNKLASDSTSLISRVSEVLKVIGAEVNLEDNFVFTGIGALNKALDSLDIEAVTAKMNSLGKEPTAVLDTNAASTITDNSETKIEYNKSELIAARNYETLMEDSGPIAASNYWSTQVKKRFVRPNVSPKEILNSIK
jgi:hypothetical protein